MGRLPKAKPESQEDKRIRCAKCGSANQANFYATKDPSRIFYGKLSYCKECVKSFYLKYLKKYDNPNLAIYYLCRKIDIPYIHNAYTGAIDNIRNPNSKIQGEDALVSAYMKNMGFADANGWGSCFDDSQGENEIAGLTSFAEMTKVKRNRKLDNIDQEEYEMLEFDTDDLIQKWGLFENDDLAYLESEYLDWHDKLNGITDKSTDIMVKQVCLQCNEIRKDRENGTNVDKKLNTLQNLLKTSGLIEMQDKNAEQKRVGVSINDIEYKRPLKSVDPDFEDVDSIRDIIYGFTGAMCRTLGKENAYTEKFDEIYGKYSIDIIDNLIKLKSEDPDSELDIEGVTDESE